MTWQIKSSDAGETETIAAAIGQRLRGGEVLELRSDIGGGKTTFVRGLVAGLGSQDKVASPSFTISREYQAGELTVHHYDFYRLTEPGIMAHELSGVVQDPKTITIVEWAEQVADVLPAERLRLTISMQSDGSRLLQFSVPPELHYLVPEAQL